MKVEELVKKMQLKVREMVRAHREVLDGLCENDYGWGLLDADWGLFRSWNNMRRAVQAHDIVIRAACDDRDDLGELAGGASLTVRGPAVGTDYYRLSIPLADGFYHKPGPWCRIGQCLHSSRERKATKAEVRRALVPPAEPTAKDLEDSGAEVAKLEGALRASMRRKGSKRSKRRTTW